MRKDVLPLVGQKGSSRIEYKEAGAHLDLPAPVWMTARSKAIMGLVVEFPTASMLVSPVL